MKDIVRRVLGLACSTATSTPVSLNHSDIQFWPSGAIDSLKSAKLIRPATPSALLECRGCEECCLRPVVSIKPDDEKPSLLMSTCDLFDDLGPFFHPPNAAARWLTSRKLVTDFFQSQCALEIVEVDDLYRRVRFRSIEVDGIRRTVSLEFAAQPTVYIGCTAVPLQAFIVGHEKSIHFDKEHFYCCFLASEEQHSGGKPYRASRSVQESNKLLIEIRDENLQRHLDRLALQYPGLNKEQLAARIAREKEFSNVGVGRIMRVTRMPSRIPKK